MENPKPEKVAVVDEVAERLTDSESVIVTEYRGLTVAQLAELRRALRPAGGTYKVYKNTLVRRAAAQAEVDITDHLTGPVALAFTSNRPDGSPGDVVVVAKALQDFAKTNDALVIKGGVYEGNSLAPEDVKALADVEPREVLLAKFAGLLQAPMSQFARLLQAVPQNFAYGLQALIDEGGAPGAPSDAPVTDDVQDAPADEESAEAPAESESTDAPSGDESAEGTSESETTDTPEVASAEDDSAEESSNPESENE